MRHVRSPEERARSRLAQQAREAPGGLLSRLAGGRDIPAPCPGYWLVRPAKNALPAPACIRWEHTTAEPGEPDNDMAGTRSRFLVAMIVDRVVDLDRVWNWRHTEIDEAEFRYRMANHEWAKQYAPHEPAAKPFEKPDLMQAPLPF